MGQTHESSLAISSRLLFTAVHYTHTHTHTHESMPATCIRRPLFLPSSQAILETSSPHALRAPSLHTVSPGCLNCTGERSVRESAGRRVGVNKTVVD